MIGFFAGASATANLELTILHGSGSIGDSNGGRPSKKKSGIFTMWCSVPCLTCVNYHSHLHQ